LFPRQYGSQNNHERRDKKMAAPVRFGVGQSVLRKEDDALIRGKGRYTDDYAPQAALRCLVLRSPHAHAKYTVDAGRARTLPGVALILTADDVGELGNLPCLFNLETDPFTGPPYPILPKDEVRHVGDAVACVVAETSDQARDAIEAIEVKWARQPGQPPPARHSLPERAQYPDREDAGDLPRRWRRFWHETVSVPRICAVGGRRAKTEEGGEMGCRSLRALHGRCTGPRQRHHRE